MYIFLFVLLSAICFLMGFFHQELRPFISIKSPKDIIVILCLVPSLLFYLIAFILFSPIWIACLCIEVHNATMEYFDLTEDEKKATSLYSYVWNRMVMLGKRK